MAIGPVETATTSRGQAMESDGERRKALLHNMYWYRTRWAEEEVKLLELAKPDEVFTIAILYDVELKLKAGFDGREFELSTRAALVTYLNLDDQQRGDEEGLTSQHYLGHTAVRNAIEALHMQPSRERPVKVLDIGGGLGSTVRYMASNLPYLEGISVDISESFANLAEQIDRKECASYREGSSTKYIAADIFNTTQATLGGPFDYGVSLLCFCHMDSKRTLLDKSERAAATRRHPSAATCILKISSYSIEMEYGKQVGRNERRGANEDGRRFGFCHLRYREALRDVVACPALCTVEEYRAELESVFGKDSIKLLDCDKTTREWKEFTKSRFAIFEKNFDRHVSVHGEDIASAYRTFYGTTADLFDRGVIGGIRVVLSVLAK
ncbi:hypothetical protein FOZ60_002333 [Perkinsus olseni]|uniref:Methyltransferase type 11 domain-containing protein n=1 Tax=Perkinsus olseni TaxID=32597 RepID=A0A7J6PIS7_PEROL|nr:hypothetical protein FOZ60_002333 [Perkinsus olseni]